MRNHSISFLLFLSLLIPSLSKAATAQEFRDMGTALFQKGLYEKSAEYFKEAVQADPNDWQSYEDLGNAYAKMNDNGDALDAYQKSLQINPNNTTLQTLVDNLKASGAAASNPPSAGNGSAPSTNPTDNQWEDSQPTTVVKNPSQPSDNNWDSSQPTTVVKTIVVERPIRRRPRPQPIVYNDGLAPMDHARVWTQLSLGYLNAKVGDLNTSANSWNSDISNSGIWTGSAISGNDGAGLGCKLGFLLNPNMGIALGAKYVVMTNYNVNVNYQNGPSPVTVGGNPVTDSSGATVIYDSDYDQTTLAPTIVPITLDYYLFLPDSGGRFFLSAGVGYYFGNIHVDRNYSAVIANSDPNQADQYSGDLTAGALGFQAGIGRDFAITRNMSIELYAEGHYAKLTNFSGTITDVNGNSANVGLAAEPSLNNEVFVEDQTQIGGTGNRYATVDFTSIEVGFALNFYHF